MKKMLLLLALFVYQIIFCQTTEKISKNAVIVEVFGHTNGILSLGYERFFKPTKNEYLTFVIRPGIGIEPGYTGTDGKRYNQKTIFPLVASLLIGKKEHYAQIGAGYSAGFISGLHDENLQPPRFYPRYVSGYSLSVGYRFMTNDFELQFFPVFIKDSEEEKIKSNIGMSVGFRF